jgi:hypothetical protein
MRLLRDPITTERAGPVAAVVRLRRAAAIGVAALAVAAPSAVAGAGSPSDLRSPDVQDAAARSAAAVAPSDLRSPDVQDETTGPNDLRSPDVQDAAIKASSLAGAARAAAASTPASSTPSAKAGDDGLNWGPIAIGGAIAGGLMLIGLGGAFLARRARVSSAN